MFDLYLSGLQDTAPFRHHIKMHFNVVKLVLIGIVIRTSTQPIWS